MVLYSVHFQKGGSMEPYEPPPKPATDNYKILMTFVVNIDHFNKQL